MDAIADTVKIYFVFNITQPISLGTVKLSVLLFHRRIFRVKHFDIISKAYISIVLLWMTGYFFADLFACGIQFWSYWGSLYDYLGHCIKIDKLYESLAISDVILDVMVLSLPIPQVTLYPSNGSMQVLIR